MQQLMHNYTYQKYGEQDAYGQPTLGKGGTISMAISVISNQINDNVLYRDAQYIGLTRGALDDKCIVNYGNDKLKVLLRASRGFKSKRLKNRLILITL